jgi:hypothetical protein
MTNLHYRRAFFQASFPSIPSGATRGARRENVLKNTCPACGYMTLPARASFDICPICFWEDDGQDDPEEEKEGNTNPSSLKEYRGETQHLLNRIKHTDFPPADEKNIFQNKFRQIDAIIENYTPIRKEELLRVQDELVGLFVENRIFGLSGLFEKK